MREAGPVKTDFPLLSSPELDQVQRLMRIAKSPVVQIRSETLSLDRLPKSLVVIGGLNWAYDLSGVPANRIAGYNIVSWTEGGVTYWAVSDLGTADLVEARRRRDDVLRRYPESRGCQLSLRLAPASARRRRARTAASDRSYAA